MNALASQQTLAPIQFDEALLERCTSAFAKASTRLADLKARFATAKDDEDELVAWFITCRDDEASIAFEAAGGLIAAGGGRTWSGHDTRPFRDTRSVDVSAVVQLVANSPALFSMEIERLQEGLRSKAPLEVSNDLRALAEQALLCRSDAPPEGWAESLLQSMRR